MANVIITANTSWYLYNFRKNTILSLIGEGHSVIAVAPEDRYSIELSRLGCYFIPIKIDQGGTNPVKDIMTFLNFVIIFCKSSTDVALNFTPKNNIYGTLAAKLCGVKCINNIAGLGVLFVNEGFVTKFARVLYKISQRCAYKIFFQNEDDRTLFLKNKMASKDVTERLPGSGVDLARFSITPSVDDGVTRFLLIARMLFDKGVGHYVEAARILRLKYGDKVEFHLLGFLDVQNPSSISREQMDAWVSEGIVKYLGVSDEVEKNIATSDCIVLPSFYREGVPKSLLEAGAMGKPIITTNSIGCRETVDDSINGFLCEPRSTESLTLMLDKMIDIGYDARLKMGIASRKKIEREFDEKIVIRRYLEAVRTALLN